mmetsp:Transcript_12618/g.34870  ORF Transcript_12618/g.34870 Transcript_12618/m.34870 type:complete len:96 (-) Transcript_12618:117-404(-)
MEQFGIKFTFMSMVDVNGRDASPVYRFLKAQPQCAGDITWNYRTKFLVSRDGSSVARFDGVLTVDLEPEISRLLAPPEDPWDPADAPPSAPGCGS